MANYNDLKTGIDAVIKTNGRQKISGAALNTQLKNMIAELGAGYQYMGIATPATNPGTPDANVFYLASEAGTYTNFGGIVINEGEVCVLVWDGTWTKQVTGAATADKLNQLGQQVIYDVTKNNSTAGPNNDGKFESLSALLSDANLSTLIPIAIRCGGMSIRFVQTSDNKYVQFRYMSDDADTVATFTDVANWQSENADAEPIVESQNMVTSGGVFNQLSMAVQVRPSAKEDNGNMIVYDSIIDGYYYSQTNGVRTASDIWSCVPLFEVKPNTGYAKNAVIVVTEFDSNFNFLGYVAMATTTFTTNANTKYIGCSFQTTYKNSARMCEGTSYGNWKKGERLYSQAQVKGLEDALTGLEKSIENKVEKVVGKNLFNKDSNDVVTGYYLALDDGNPAVNVNFEYLFIEGLPNTTYVISGVSNNAIVGFWNGNTYIEGVQIASHPYTAVTTPANTTKIGLSVRITDASGIQFEIGSVATSYVPYQSGVATQSINDGAVTFNKLGEDVKVDKIVHVGPYREYTSLLEGLKAGGENAKVVVDSGTYDIEAEYKDFYGDDFFANYPLDGYHSQTDKFYAGLWLAPGVQLIANGLVTITFPYADGTRQSDLPHDDPNYDPVAQYFSVLNPTYNCVVDGIDISLALNNCRYHIHDDFATAAGTNVFRNIHLSGTAQKQTAFGCGMGTKNIYVIENCKITDNLLSISYHNNTNAGKNKLIIKDTFCSGNVAARMYGTSTQITEVVVSGCKANRIYKDYVDEAHYPNENMDLIQWNNVTNS